MRFRDELIVQALVGMGVFVTVHQMKESRSIVAAVHPPVGSSRMPDWVYRRRSAERKSGFSDPALIEMGLSALPDAPPKPPKTEKPPKPPRSARRGRPPMGESAMPPWVVVRRHRERASGFSDPLLVEMGLSALPDAPVRPKVERSPKPPKTEKSPKSPKPPTVERLPKPPKGSPSWAASESWGGSRSDVRSR